MDAVREHDMLAGDADRVEILDVAPACLALDHLALRAILRRMRVDKDAALARESSDLFEQFPRAAYGETRRKAVAYAPLVATVPLFEERERFAYRVRCILAQSLGHLVALVHHALADRRAKARLFDYAKDLF